MTLALVVLGVNSLFLVGLHLSKCEICCICINGIIVGNKAVVNSKLCIILIVFADLQITWLILRLEIKSSGLITILYVYMAFAFHFELY